VLIPAAYLDQLRAAGLLVGDPFPPDHVAFPDGVDVAKPARAGGHSLPEYCAYWAPNGSLLDAPAVTLHADGSHWCVTSWDYVPGPGPGDFVDRWNTPEEAVADILDFYFGDPARMEAKRERRG
jgi:hypothetical protein